MVLRLCGVLAGLSLLVGLLGGCGGATTVELDGGGPDAAPGDVGAITIVGETAIGLTPGASAPFVARWTDAAGRPVLDRDVSLALDGMARDSSLFALVARTNDAGEASGTVIAGELPATFRVRVSAPGATPAYLDVAVGAEGFGRLLVTLEGGDERTITRRTVLLHQGAGVLCDDALGRAEADRTRTVGDSGMVELTALPAGQLFTIVARAENARGTIVAEGCEEGVAIEVDREVRRTITLVARQLGVEGEYATFVELAPGAASAGDAIDGLSTALEAVVVTGGGDAVLMLDALDAQLRDAGAIAEADALESDRLTGDPESTLTAALLVAGATPSTAVRSLLGEIATRSASIGIDGTLAIARATEAGSLASFTRGSVVLGPAGTERVVADLSAVGVEARTPAAMRWLGDVDRLELDELTISLPLARLVAATIQGIARVRAGGDPAALVIADSGCDALAGWIAEDVDLAAVCDPACALDACERAVRTVLDLTETAAAPLDEARATLVFSGVLSSEDADGDLAVDALRATVIAGAWTSADGATSEPVDASFSATRVSPLP